MRKTGRALESCILAVCNVLLPGRRLRLCGLKTQVLRLMMESEEESASKRLALLNILVGLRLRPS